MRFKLPDRLQFLESRKAVQKETDVSLAGKVCVINGATSGVGLAAAKRLVAGGANLVLLARNKEKAEHVRGLLKSCKDVNIDIIIADFINLDDVRTAAEIILNNYPKIDLLINSAGVFSTKRIITPQGFEMVFCINHLAPFLLTRLLLERIIASAPARILHVNSQGHRFNGLKINDINWARRFYNGYKSYGASKTAQLLTVWELADRLKETRVTINAMHPGAVKTNIGNNNGPLYRWYSRHIIWHLLKDPKISGSAIYFLVAAPELSTVNGRYFNLTTDEKPAPHALDRDLGKYVWQLSERLTGLTMGR